MNKNDSATHDVPSPKHSYYARKPASTIQAHGGHPTAPPAPMREISVLEEREIFDVPHTQYY